jgi:phosphoribosylformylglycinamidine (FGAM) synthase-like enzyme
VLAIHDVGAGGHLATRFPSWSTAHRLAAPSSSCVRVPNRGERHVADGDLVQRGQERYVLAIVRARSHARFESDVPGASAAPYAVVGRLTGERQLRVRRQPFRQLPGVDLPLELLLGKAAAHASRRAARGAASEVLPLDA